MPANIVIADDLPDALHALTSMLRGSGFEVCPIRGGKQVLQAVLAHQPDLVILDMDMPDMSGLEVCARLKEQENLSEIPVIFVSALKDTQDKLSAFEAGGVDYITKPFQRLEVLARVETQLKLRRQKLQLHERWVQLQNLERLRDDLTHMIVHDMRAPLMAVEGNLKLLDLFESGGLSDEGKGYIREARHAVARLTKMALEMLAVSKLEEGKMELRLEPWDLVELGRKVVDQASGFYNGKSLHFATNLTKLLLAVDRELIIRVLENLVNNALKFTSEGGVVSVNLIADEAEARFEVVDDGPGIAAEQISKLFHKFGQVELRNGKNQNGTGLGLAFCKLAIEAHGGRIGVQSEPGRGSNFWFILRRTHRTDSIGH